MASMISGRCRFEVANERLDAAVCALQSVDEVDDDIRYDAETHITSIVYPEHGRLFMGAGGIDAAAEFLKTHCVHGSFITIHDEGDLMSCTMLVLAEDGEVITRWREHANPFDHLCDALDCFGFQSSADDGWDEAARNIVKARLRRAMWDAYDELFAKGFVGNLESQWLNVRAPFEYAADSLLGGALDWFVPIRTSEN